MDEEEIVFKEVRFENIKNKRGFGFYFAAFCLVLFIIGLGICIATDISGWN